MSAELEDIHEECGIFGVWGHPDAARLTYFGLHALQHRGQEGAGIVSNDHGHLIGHRGLGLLTQVFSDEREIQRLRGDRAIGHVRYATAGSGSTDNIQPFIFRFSDGDMALAHNGNLTNCPTLRRELESQGAIFRSNSDTEVLMHLIRRSEQPTFVDKLKEALNTVHGGFAYLLMTENAMIGALDPNGFRPLSLGRMTNGAYVLASETCALDIVGAELVRDIRPGEIVVVDDDGYRIDTYTDQTQLAICSMEFIYFARPDSNIYGVNVHSARKRMGARLAQESPVDADMVIAVPNSSLSAASGYSEAIFLNLQKYGLLSFILPILSMYLGYPSMHEALSKLDEKVRAGIESGNPVPKDEMIYCILKPLVVFDNPEGTSPEELFKEGFRQAKILISPMTPPNYELEKAVDRLLDDMGMKRSRNRKSAEARVPRKKPNNMGRKSAANEELSSGPKKSRKKRKKAKSIPVPPEPRTMAEEHDL